jgi:SRSO17 transposase
MADEERVAVDGAAAALELAAGRLRPHFRRGTAHRHACAYLRGLLGTAERKNGWQLAEAAGYREPRAMQRVLDRSVWDADAARDELRAYVLEHLGEPGGVLVVDETGFLKQGRKSVGVKRQYSGTAGRIENCQVGVFLGYASAKGRAAIDRSLYLPQEWCDDPDRRAAAGVPASVAFRTKPQLAIVLLERALDAGVPAAWVTADEVYGNDYAFRRTLEERGQAYVVAVKRTQAVSTWPPYGTIGQAKADALAGALPTEAWWRLSCGDGAQGERVYDWAYVPLRPAMRDGWLHALLVRRHPMQADELAFYLVHLREGTALAEVVRAAGSRWAIEDTFKLAKGQAGLDHYETRSWHGWHRHVTLALWALAILAGEAARAKGGTSPTATGSSRSASPSCAA